MYDHKGTLDVALPRFRAVTHWGLQDDTKLPEKSKYFGTSTLFLGIPTKERGRVGFNSAQPSNHGALTMPLLLRFIVVGKFVNQEQL